MFNPANAVIIGATGGIGSAIVARLAVDESIGTIHAVSRSAPGSLPDKAVHHCIDITEEESIICAAADIAHAGPLDLVIVSTGVLHNDTGIMPEKTIRDLSPQAMSAVFETNCIGPTILAKHFLPHMRKGSKSVFAALSARVGSISDNRLGGWLSYRTSKAALNMALKTLSIEHARKFPDSLVVGLHPGTVATALSEPFSSRVSAEKLFTPGRAARQLLEVIDSLGPSDSGKTFAWDGVTIPF